MVMDRLIYNIVTWTINQQSQMHDSLVNYTKLIIYDCCGGISVVHDLA